MGITCFAWENAVDAGTIAATSESPNLPVSNLQNARTGRVWRPKTTTASFTATFAAATAIDVLALAGCKLDAADTIRHRLYDAANSLIYDSTVQASGVLTGYGLHIKKLSSQLTAMKWVCDVDAPSRVSMGFFDIKRAFAAPVWQPAIGIVRPWDRTWRDDADKNRSKRSGAVLIGDGARYRTLNVQLGWMEESDVVQAEAMAYAAGVRGQVLCIPDLGGDMPRQAILGRIDQIQPIRQTKDVFPPVYEQGFSITQDI